jgi:hypothetical protein
MVKIKRKVEKNLPQLIEWAWGNPELSQYKMFEKIGATMRDYVSFNNEENGVRLNGTVKPTDLFTVTTEEEITEDTEIKTLVEVTECGNIHTHMEATVKEEKRNSSVEFHALLNGRLVLIWTQENGLVE